MITINMEQIVAFRENSNFFSEANIPLKGAYKLNKIKKAVEKEGEFYITKLQEILEKYAKRDEEGNLIFSEDETQIEIKEGMVEECNKELNDLENLEVEIDNYGLTIEDLGDDLVCTPDELEALMPFMS